MAPEFKKATFSVAPNYSNNPNLNSRYWYNEAYNASWVEKGPGPGKWSDYKMKRKRK